MQCGGIFNNVFTANLPRKLPLKKIENRLRFDRIMAMSLWPHFFGPPCTFVQSFVELHADNWAKIAACVVAGVAQW